MLALAREVDAVIFGIGVGQRVDRRVLETLAAASGGEASFPEDVSQLESEYRRIVEKPAPPLGHHLFVHRLPPQRSLARGRDPNEEPRRRRPQPRRVLLTGEVEPCEISGKPNEGWMTLVPVTVLVLVVVIALGGPEAFVNTLSSWATDLVGYSAGWLKHL